MREGMDAGLGLGLGRGGALIQHRAWSDRGAVQQYYLPCRRSSSRRRRTAARPRPRWPSSGPSCARGWGWEGVVAGGKGAPGGAFRLGGVSRRRERMAAAPCPAGAGRRGASRRRVSAAGQRHGHLGLRAVHVHVHGDGRGHRGCFEGWPRKKKWGRRRTNLSLTCQENKTVAGNRVRRDEHT